jgi:hypothetical protein
MNANIGEALLATEQLPMPDIPPGPWPTEAELEIRQRLADIQAHLLRSDRIVMEVQLEVRRVARQQTAVALRIEGKIDALVAQLRDLLSNGNGHG